MSEKNRPGGGFLILYIYDLKDPLYLLIQRDDDGKWEIPGGGVEEGESFREAALREFLEEVGLILTNKMVKRISVSSRFLLSDESKVMTYELGVSQEEFEKMLMGPTLDAEHKWNFYTFDQVLEMWRNFKRECDSLRLGWSTLKRIVVCNDWKRDFCRNKNEMKQNGRRWIKVPEGFVPMEDDYMDNSLHLYEYDEEEPSDLKGHDGL